MSAHQEKLDLSKLFTLKTFLFMMFGVSSAVFALQGFMIPNHFFDGGVTGISLLLHEIYHVKFSFFVIPINLVFFVIAYRKVGKLFALRSMIAVVILALGVDFVHITPVTTDKLLIAIFGGCFIGLGMGLVMRAAGALDGFEVLAVFAIRKYGLTISEVILFLNSIIFLTAGIKFGIGIAMYSMITYFAALKTLDYVVDGIEEYISLTVISKESEAIKHALVNQFGKGITVYKGERGYLPGSFHHHVDCDVIVTIVTRFELLNISKEIEKIDATAFVYTHKINETKGGVLKRKVSH